MDLDDLVEQPEATRMSRAAVGTFALAVMGAALCCLGSLVRCDSGKSLLGIAGFMFLGAVALGVATTYRITRSREALRGRRLAEIGAIIGILGVIWATIEPGTHIQGHSPQGYCSSNLKQLSTAMRMYSDDNGGCLPDRDGWNEAVKPYVKNPVVLRCPAANSPRPSYAMNGSLSCVRRQDIPSHDAVVMLFDSVPGENLSGGPGLLPSPMRHGCHNIAFADGHAHRSDTTSAVRSLGWSLSPVP